MPVFKSLPLVFAAALVTFALTSPVSASETQVAGSDGAKNPCAGKTPGKDAMSMGSDAMESGAHKMDEKMDEKMKETHEKMDEKMKETHEKMKK